MQQKKSSQLVLYICMTWDYKINTNFNVRISPWFSKHVEIYTPLDLNKICESSNKSNRKNCCRWILELKNLDTLIKTISDDHRPIWANTYPPRVEKCCPIHSEIGYLAKVGAGGWKGLDTIVIPVHHQDWTAEPFYCHCHKRQWYHCNWLLCQSGKTVALPRCLCFQTLIWIHLQKVTSTQLTTMTCAWLVYCCQ